jgi:hypothetical protein
MVVESSLPVTHHHQALAFVPSQGELVDEELAEGERGGLFRLGVRVGIDADHSDRGLVRTVERDCRQPALVVRVGVSVRDARVPDECDSAAAFPTCRRERPEGGEANREGARGECSLRYVVVANEQRLA